MRRFTRWLRQTPLGQEAVRPVRRVIGSWWRTRARLFRASYDKRPAPFGTCIRMQRRAAMWTGDPNYLSHAGRRPQPPPFKNDPELSECLGGYQDNGFALSPETLEWMAGVVNERKFRTVLEFGSGSSTVILCTLLSRLHGPSGFRLLSVEQDPDYAKATRQRLAELPGHGCCLVVEVPLHPGNAGGRPTSFYDLPGSATEALRWMGKAEFVLIDGPFADGPCRYWTLPAVRGSLARPMMFAMDDALREKEIFAGQLWQRQGIEVVGVLAVGTGVMLGRVG